LNHIFDHKPIWVLVIFSAVKVVAASFSRQKEQLQGSELRLACHDPTSSDRLAIRLAEPRNLALSRRPGTRAEGEVLRTSHLSDRETLALNSHIQQRIGVIEQYGSHVRANFSGRFLFSILLEIPLRILPAILPNFC
jgi:hypothetical protein